MSVRKFYGFYLECPFKVKLLDSYCLDVYGSQLWNYSKHDVDMFFYCMAEIYSEALENS